MPPDFPSSHDLGMLAKKLQLKKEKLILIMRKIKIKIVKNKKSNTYTGINLLPHKCGKKSANPSTVSYVAHGGQQTTTAPTYKLVNNS